MSHQCHPNIWSESYLEGFPCTSSVRLFNISRTLCNGADLASVPTLNIKVNRNFLFLILELLIHMIYNDVLQPTKWIDNIQLISCGSKRADFCGMLRYIEKKLITLRLKSLLGRIYRWHFTFELVIVSPTGLRRRTNICSPSLVWWHPSADQSCLFDFAGVR